MWPLVSLRWKISNMHNHFYPQTVDMDFRPRTQEEIEQRNDQRKANKERSHLRIREFRRNSRSPVYQVQKVPLHYLSTEARNLSHVQGTYSGLVTIVSGQPTVQPTDQPTDPVRKQEPARLRERQLAAINKILQLSTNSWIWYHTISPRCF